MGTRYSGHLFSRLMLSLPNLDQTDLLSYCKRTRSRHNSSGLVTLCPYVCLVFGVVLFCGVLCRWGWFWYLQDNS
jgi:hypothetical protein